MTYFPQLTDDHRQLLLNILKEDILERYDNIEYWHEDIISSFYLDNDYNCCDCDEPIQKAINRGVPVRCWKCLNDNDIDKKPVV